MSKKDTSPGSSCATAIAISLKEMQEAIYRDVLDEDAAAEPEEPSVPTTNHKHAEVSGARCPECGEEISFEGGCNICKACGWSKCG